MRFTLATAAALAATTTATLANKEGKRQVSIPLGTVNLAFPGSSSNLSPAIAPAADAPAPDTLAIPADAALGPADAPPPPSVEAPPAAEALSIPADAALGPSDSPAVTELNGTPAPPFAPFQMSSLLSTPTAITFMLADISPSNPDPNYKVVCSAVFADNSDPAFPYDPQPCLDSTTGQPPSSGSWTWQILAYAGPQLWILKVSHSFLNPAAGPCAVQEDGSPVYCNTSYFGDSEISRDTGPMVCDEEAQVCTTDGDYSFAIPILSAVAKKI